MKNILFILSAFAIISFTSCNRSAAEHEEHAEESSTVADAPEGESEGAHVDEVTITPEQMQQMGIVVEALKGGSVNAEIQRPATAMFNPDKTVQVGPRISAKVEKIQVDLGQKVTKGQPLAILSSVELGKIKAEYLTLLSQYETLNRAYLREKKLYGEKIGSESDYLQAKAAFEDVQAKLKSSKETLKLFGISGENVGKGDFPLSYFTLKTPISGVVQERNLSPGQTISSDSTPIHIVNNSQMWVMIDAYENDIANIKKGQNIRLTIKSLPGKVFEGKIDWISYALDKDTRTVKIRATVSNPKGLLKNGMYGTASIWSDTDANRPIVPVEAIQTFENSAVVFVPADEKDTFMPVPVVTGNENNGWIEIAGNVHVGEPVVTAGAFHLMSTLTSKTRSADHHH